MSASAAQAPAGLLKTFVHTLRWQAQDVISVELRAADGSDLPPFTPGAHIDLHLPNDLIRSYSLCNDSRERHRYVVGVLRDRASRGGSRCVHHDLRVGMELHITTPSNHFALDGNASHSVLLAGGIGITPLLCMARHLHAQGASFEMFYFARTRAGAAFLPILQGLGMPLHLHFDDEAGGPPDLRALLERRAPDSTLHHYACGPAPMLDAFERHCAGIGHHNAHVERFQAVAVAAAEDAKNRYTVELRRSGRSILVEPGQSLLESLQAAGIVVESSCCEGVCGTCETRVLEGTPDHRDSVLTAQEKASGKVMMICVSGSKSDSLVLDL